MCYNYPENKDSIRKSEPKVDILNKSEKYSQSFRPKNEEPYHQTDKNKLHKCDKCLKTFDYHHSMLRHMKFDHPVYSQNSTSKDEKVTEKNH